MAGGIAELTITDIKDTESQGPSVVVGYFLAWE